MGDIIEVIKHPTLPYLINSFNGKDVVYFYTSKKAIHYTFINELEAITPIEDFASEYEAEFLGAAPPAKVRGPHLCRCDKFQVIHFGCKCDGL